MFKEFDELLPIFLTENNMKPCYPVNVIKVLNDAKDKVINTRIEYALAGFQRKDINVKLEGKVLVVEVSKNDETKAENEVSMFNGISYRNMTERYNLMSDADIDNIKVNFKNGLLVINIPTKEEYLSTRSIKID